MVKDNRAGNTRRVRMRQQLWLFAVRIKWPLTGFTIAAIAILVAFNYILSTRSIWWAGLLTGMVGTWFLVLMVAGLVIETGGMPGYFRGKAEAQTGAALSKLNSHGWTHLSDLNFVSFGDVDHVAIGPRGVVVIETVWLAPVDSDSDLEHRALRHASDDAQRNAHHVQLRILAKPSSLRTVVRPVVVFGEAGTSGSRYTRPAPRRS